MSSVFRKIDEEGRRIDRQVGVSPPRIGSILPQGQEPTEDIEVIEETATQARGRERRRLVQRRGRGSTILSGIMTALKKRLGA